jgi:cytoskeletal protein RodZ
MSLSDVSEQIHIRSVYLQALENEDWSTIGAPVYTRGFIRTYARFLGIEPESAIQRYSEGAAVPPPAAPAREPVAEKSERRAPSPLLWIFGTLAVVLVGVVLYKYYALQAAPVAKLPESGIPIASAAAPASPGESATAAPSAAIAETSPQASPSPTPSPQPSAKLVRTLTIKLSEASWLRIVIDGQNVMEGVFPQGTVRTFHGEKASVRIGNAGGVDLAVNGKDVGKLGNSGDVVERNISLAGG